VLSGAVTVDVAGQVTVLGVGDAITFDGGVARCYTNSGGGQARFSLAVFQPRVGAVSGANRPGRHR